MVDIRDHIRITKFVTVFATTSTVVLSSAYQRSLVTGVLCATYQDARQIDRSKVFSSKVL